MRIAAHDASFAKKVGISQGVAREFHQADKGIHEKLGVTKDGRVPASRLRAAARRKVKK